MISTGDLSLVISWLALIFVLHFSLLSFFRNSFSKVAVPLSFSISLLLYTLLSFWFVYLHLPVIFVLFPFFLIIAYTVCRGYLTGGVPSLIPGCRFLSSEWRYYALFFGVFFSMLILRLYSPDISSAEKFMDHGFIASMMRIPVIPPLDPWFSGGDLSVYYYLGHWMLASLGLITGVPSNILFTLALPTIAALAAVNLYGVGHLLLPRFRLLPVLFLFLINPAFVSLSLSGTPWATLLWNSTRVIEGTINEYPLFSFIFGDVHAHVLGFFPQTTLILLITLAITCWKKIEHSSRLLLLFCSGLALGSIPPTNSWDILIQAPLIILTGIILLIDSSGLSLWSPLYRISSIKTGLNKIISAIREESAGGFILKNFSPARGALVYIFLVPFLGILSYLPFYLMMKAQGIDGIGVVTKPSSVSSFLLVSGWFLIIIALSLIPVFRKRPWLIIISVPFIITGYYSAAIAVALLSALLVRRKGAGDLCAGVGLIILIFCELLYLKDNMGDQYFRMNTVFKLSITAWLFFSVAAASMLGEILISCSARVPWTTRVSDRIIPLALFLLLVLPVMVTISHAGPYTPTFDGFDWLSADHADDREAVTWLRGLDGNLTIVEAEDGDYQYFSRISAFTGIPAILGWPFHESMWRENTPSGWYGDRTTAIRAIYEDPVRCIALMKKYGADLLYVGKSEEERYNVTLPSEGLEPVFSHGSVTIYRVLDNQYNPGFS